jgi:hypothetical protein
VLYFIAFGFDDDEFGFHAEVGEFLLCVVGLPKR